MTSHNTIGYATLGGVIWAIYALSPGGVTAAIAAASVAICAVGAAVLVRRWDDLHLLIVRNRERNPSRTQRQRTLP